MFAVLVFCIVVDGVTFSDKAGLALVGLLLLGSELKKIYEKDTNNTDDIA